MKNVLIVGENSYIGNHLEEILKINDSVNVKKISFRNNNWKKISYENFDTVVHLAAVVHNRNADNDLLNKVNTHDAIEIAKLSKSKGIKHFIFLSTMGVYSQKESEIKISTKVSPSNKYATSKLNAERELQLMSSDKFNVSIVRPPIVYGKNAPGNFLSFEKMALLLPIFPKYNNRRSMIYIKNLAEFLRLLIINGENGIYYPQNNEYINTFEMFKIISKLNGKKLISLPFMSKLLEIFSQNNSTFNKVFGDFYYSKDLNGGPNKKTYQKIGNYNLYNLHGSLEDMYK